MNEQASSRILIVEDESIVAMDIQRRLERMSYTVVGTASAGEEAIDAAGRLCPDLVLMDIKLKDGMDGTEAARRIRENSRVPVVFLTAYSDDATLKSASAAEPGGYVVKPFGDRDLHATIRMALYRHRTDTALRQQKQFQETILESLNHPFYVIDANDYRVIQANAACGFGDLSGGATCFELAHKTDSPCNDPEHPCPVEEVKKTKRPLAVEHTHFDKAGNKRQVEIHAHPILDDSGNVCKVIEYVLDVTDRKEAEEKLRRESLMRKTLLDNLPCIAMILRKRTREIVACNSAARKVGAVQGKTCYGTCAERDDPCPFCLAPEVWDVNEPRRLEVEYRGNYYDASWIPLTEEMYVHYILDISDHKKAEQRILDNQAQLKSLASQLSRMEERERRRLATVLHDQIGQTLVFSKFKLDQLRTSDFPGEPAGALEEICDSLARVIQETRTLTFDLSSPILYELGFEAAVAEWLVDEVREKHGIETEFDDDGRQKPLDDDIRAFLFRNLRELLINVVKHARAYKVKVGVRRSGQDICVTVEDDGIGFDPAEVKAVSAKRGKFGLFSIRERLEQLGGLIQIDSGPGRGSRILMMAPLKCGTLTDGKEL